MQRTTLFSVLVCLMAVLAGCGQLVQTPNQPATDTPQPTEQPPAEPTQTPTTTPTPQPEPQNTTASQQTQTPYLDDVRRLLNGSTRTQSDLIRSYPAGTYNPETTQPIEVKAEDYGNYSTRIVVTLNWSSSIETRRDQVNTTAIAFAEAKRKAAMTGTPVSFDEIDILWMKNGGRYARGRIDERLIDEYITGHREFNTIRRQAGMSSFLHKMHGTMEQQIGAFDEQMYQLGAKAETYNITNVEQLGPIIFVDYVTKTEESETTSRYLEMLAITREFGTGVQNGIVKNPLEKGGPPTMVITEKAVVNGSVKTRGWTLIDGKVARNHVAGEIETGKILQRLGDYYSANN